MTDPRDAAQAGRADGSSPGGTDAGPPGRSDAGPRRGVAAGPTDPSDAVPSDGVAAGPPGATARLAEYALAKPGAWPDQPWEGDHVAKVAEKIFCFLGDDTIGVACGSRAEADEWLEEFPDDAAVMPYIGRHGWNTLRVGSAIPDDALREAIDTSYDLVVAKLPRSRRPPA